MGPEKSTLSGIELRHLLHRFPDRFLQETNTIRILKNFLHDHTSFEIIDRDRWFYSVKYGTSKEPAIAFRADMDALPMDEGITIYFRLYRVHGPIWYYGYTGRCRQEPYRS